MRIFSFVLLNASECDFEFCGDIRRFCDASECDFEFCGDDASARCGCANLNKRTFAMRARDASGRCERLYLIEQADKFIKLEEERNLRAMRARVLEQVYKFIPT